MAQIDRFAKKMDKLITKTAEKKIEANYRVKANQQARRVANAKRSASIAKTQEAMESWNPIKRHFAKKKQLSAKKHEVKMRELESQAQVAELDPQLALEKARAENRVQVEKSRFRTKTASATAMASGMAALGRGLSDENNQDDKASQENELMKIKTIFGQNGGEADSDSDSGLKRGVE